MSAPQWTCAACGQPLASPAPDALAAHRATPGACQPVPAQIAAPATAALSAARDRLAVAYAAEAAAQIPLEVPGPPGQPAETYLYSCGRDRRADYLGAADYAARLTAAARAVAPDAPEVPVLLVGTRQSDGLDVPVPLIAAQVLALIDRGIDHLQWAAEHYYGRLAAAEALAATAAGPDPADPAAVAALAALNALDWAPTP